MTATTSPCNLAMISLGVPAGTIKPFQELASTPGATASAVLLPCYQLHRIVLMPARHPLLKAKRVTLGTLAAYPHLKRVVIEQAISESLTRRAHP
ncbi:MAG TPA: hypothetical protein VGC70_03475 [Burkholderiales bacterium]|jgi:hypothetical protein